MIHPMKTLTRVLEAKAEDYFALVLKKKGKKYFFLEAEKSVENYYTYLVLLDLNVQIVNTDQDVLLDLLNLDIL